MTQMKNPILAQKLKELNETTDLGNLLNRGRNNTGNKPAKPNSIYGSMKAVDGIDGIDHINIGPGAKSDLGRALNFDTPLKFYHPVFGEFSCTQAFWVYLTSVERDSRCRGMHGKKLNDFARKQTRKPRVLNFKAIIADSIWIKVTKHKELAAAMKATTLPFECYRTLPSNVRDRTSPAYFIMPALEEIRSALKEDRTPDFSHLIENHEYSLSDSIRKEAGLYDVIDSDTIAEGSDTSLAGLLEAEAEPNGSVAEEAAAVGEDENDAAGNK